MQLNGERIHLRLFQDTDAKAILDLHTRNGEFFQQFSPMFNEDYYTLEAKQKMIEQLQEDAAKERSYTFGIFLNETDELIGDVSLFFIQRGPLQKCLLGYILDQAQNGKGYATEAVRLAVQYAFEELKLHRIEAGTMLHNIGSQRVLEKSGFQKEGIERKGVKINGRWEDHQIYSLLDEDL